MTAGRFRPLVMLLVLAAAVLAPVPWLIPALAAVAVALTGFRILRALAGPAARRSAGPRGAGPEAQIMVGIDQRGRPAYIAEADLGAHALVVGASGAGKSTTLLRIITELIASGRPVVAIDMKGSPTFAAALAEAAVA